MNKKIHYLKSGKKTTFYLPDGTVATYTGINDPEVFGKILELTNTLSRYERICLSRLIDYEDF